MAAARVDGPIGVFDSGVGGLSVLREIRKALPGEDLLYVADSGAAPYGDRTSEFIQERAHGIVELLLGAGAKAIVVACNTATAVAVQALRARFEVAIVAMEPAVKPAAELTRTGVVGVLATSRTLASESFSRLARRYGQDVQVLRQPCPGLVELVERAQLDGAEARTMVARHVAPLVEGGADVLVLGCTHYPFLGSTIRLVAGPSVSVVDPAAAVARELVRRLSAGGLASMKHQPGTETFWTSGHPGRVQPVVEKLWGSTVDVCALPCAFSIRTLKAKPC